MDLFGETPSAKESAEYYPALVIPEPLRTEIEGIRSEICKLVGAKENFYSPPHITLADDFIAELGKEDALTKSLATVAAKFEPFTLNLNGFQKFGFKTIYIDVEDGGQVKAMGKELSLGLYTFFKQNGVKKRVAPCTTPHLTIGPSYIVSRNFDAVWKELENKPYNASCLIDHICLLKRNGKGEKWQEFQYLPFR